MKKNNRTILLGIGFILISLFVVFLIDYFQTQNLLKKGIRAKAIITGKYYEIDLDKKDTTGYSMRFDVMSDASGGKSIPDRLQSFVKQKSFNKYHEGNIVNVVYFKDDLDHAKLVEEIE
jgi:hypothetical protein